MKRTAAAARGRHANRARIFSYPVRAGHVHGPKGARVHVHVPGGFFGTWRVRLTWPGVKTAVNSARVHCGPDHRIKAEWSKNLGVGVNAAMIAAVNETIRRLSAGGKVCR